MDSFQLDQRLANDCYTLGKFEDSLLLLLNNAHVKWFILVPETSQTEFHRLDNKMQLNLLNQINQLSGFIDMHFKPTKINTAMIGNIVQQMHIHIIGRFESDPFWPDVVWGQKTSMPYQYQDVHTMVKQIKHSLPAFIAFDIQEKS